MPEGSEQKYRIVFKGEIVEGTELSDVKSRLAQLFKTTPERIERLFSGNAVTLNRNLDQATAETYCDELRTVGAVCTFEPMPEPTLSPLATTGKNSFVDKLGITHLNVFRIVRVLAAAGMATILLVYILSIIFVMTFTYDHFADNIYLLDEIKFGLGWIIYLLLLFTGILLTLAMVKPFVAPFLIRKYSITLTRKKESALFSFIEKICVSLGAKIPSFIEMNSTTNISAGYPNGIISFLEDQLTVTIGLPVMAEICLSEFAGLLATELAHYTDTLNTRLYYIITSINSWFIQAVYKKDDIDKKLELLLNTAGGKLTQIPISTALFFIWLDRKILTVFMLVGHSISRYSSRAMDYEADQHAAKLVGPETFISSLNKQLVVESAMKETFSRLRTQRKPNDNSLPDDLVFFTSAILGEMSEEDKEKARATGKTKSRSVFNLQPTLSERIKNIQDITATSPFQSDKPAFSIITNKEELSKAVTMQLYHDVLKLKIDKNDLVPSSEYLNPSEEFDGSNPSKNTF